MNQIVDSTLMKNQIRPFGFLNDELANGRPFKNVEPILTTQEDSVTYRVVSFFSIPKRYQLSIMTCIGLIISFSVRCNMGIVITRLTDVENSNSTDEVTVNYNNVKIGLKLHAFKNLKASPINLK